jgi:erythromycin esterase-like protein/predicted phosphoribosyltransferase
MELIPFRNRREAGRLLAKKLTNYAGRPDVLVLALPRGGVPVAYEVAQALSAPLDLFIVRKLGIPGYEELAMGAVATGGGRVLNEQIVTGLRIPEYIIDGVAAQEQQEIARRERLYRGGRPPPDVRGKTIILVDDGLATGATMLAAVKALRQQQPARIVVAVPTAAAETCEELRKEVDEVICAMTPQPFEAVGRWYEDFTQTTDEEVRDLLGWRRQPGELPATPRSSEVATLVEAVHKVAHPITGAARDYDPLLDLIGDARFVLLGEASHGTHDFYHERTQITERLINEKGFTAVAVEADWPDAYRANRYVRGVSNDVDAIEALADFRRFPTWMWRNTDVVEFLEWLRAYNDAFAASTAKVGFYGLDLYSLRASMKAVLQYLEKIDPDAARRARERYACFDHFGDDTQAYGLATSLGLNPSCQDAVVEQLVDLQRRAVEYARRDGSLAEDDYFDAVQNARVVKNAEMYYRSMFLEDVSSWNLRDRHMVATLESLVTHLDRQSGRAKIVLWAHNSHLGDARATDMTRRGEINVGQLVREQYGNDAVLVGFTTHRGTVTAASNWDAPAERKRVRPALPGSYEALFHEVGLARFLLILRNNDNALEGLRDAKLERAIGVIYRPDTERVSHYFHARLLAQFDAVLHFDETRALEPLERTAGWEAGEAPETFPFAV